MRVVRSFHHRCAWFLFVLQVDGLVSRTMNDMQMCIRGVNSAEYPNKHVV